MFSDATEYSEELDKQTEREILSHLNSGKIISLGINRKEIEAGETGVFALGLINKYGRTIDYQVKFDTTFIGVDFDNEIIEDLDEIDTTHAWTFVEKPVD